MKTYQTHKAFHCHGTSSGLCRNIFVHLLPLLALLVLSFSGFSQADFRKKNIGISLWTYNHSYSFSFPNPFQNPYNPGFVLSVSNPGRKNKPFHFNNSLNIGYFFHSEVDQGTHINASFTYGWFSSKGIQITGGIPVGYLRTFYTHPVFFLEDGEYVQKTDFGRNSVLLGYHFGIGYDFRKKFPKTRLGLSLKHEFWLQFPYGRTIPVLPHSSIRLGVTYYPFIK